MLNGAAAGGVWNSCENGLKVAGPVLSGDFSGNRISRRAERTRPSLQSSRYRRRPPGEALKVELGYATPRTSKGLRY
jgi:hypothetical protein